MDGRFSAVSQRPGLAEQKERVMITRPRHPGSEKTGKKGHRGYGSRWLDERRTRVENAQNFPVAPVDVVGSK